MHMKWAYAACAVPNCSPPPPYLVVDTVRRTRRCPRQTARSCLGRGTGRCRRAAPRLARCLATHAPSASRTLERMTRSGCCLVTTVWGRLGVVVSVLYHMGITKSIFLPCFCHDLSAEYERTTRAASVKVVCGSAAYRSSVATAPVFDVARDRVHFYYWRALCVCFCLPASAVAVVHCACLLTSQLTRTLCTALFGGRVPRGLHRQVADHAQRPVPHMQARHQGDREDAAAARMCRTASF